MLDNTLSTLLLGATMLIASIAGLIIFRLQSYVTKLESQLKKDVHNIQKELFEKTTEIYQVIEKSTKGMQNSVNENSSKLIDIVLDRFSTIDKRVNCIKKECMCSTNKKVNKPKKPKGPKDIMLKS